MTKRNTAIALSILACATAIWHLSSGNAESSDATSAAIKQTIANKAQIDVELNENAQSSIRNTQAVDEINDKPHPPGYYLAYEKGHEFTPETALEVLRGIVVHTGAVNSDAINSALLSQDFYVFIDQLSAYASHEEALHEQEVKRLIENNEHAVSYNYELACGVKVCALNVNYFTEDEVHFIRENIINNLPLGSQFISTVTNQHGNSELRVLFEMEQTSTLTFKTE